MEGTGHQQQQQQQQQVQSALPNQRPGLAASVWNPGGGISERRIANPRRSQSTLAKAAAAQKAAGGPCPSVLAANSSFALTAQRQQQQQQQPAQEAATNNPGAQVHGHQPHPTPAFTSNTTSALPFISIANDNTTGSTVPENSTANMSLFGAKTGGGLSINTGAANAAAGPSSTPAAGGGLFGNAAATTQPATSSGLFGGTQTGAASGGLFGNKPSTPATGGLFGASTTAAQPQQQAGGLFGGATTATPQAQPQQTGGLFGQAANTTAQTGTTGGGLFGNQTPAQQTGQQQPQQGGGLFGAAQQKPAGGGLFGQSLSTTQQQSSGLFGGGNTNTQAQQTPQQGGGGLFGSSLAPSQAKPGGLFGGGASTQQQNNTAPGLTMGQSTTQQTVPGVRVDLSNVKGTTRFNDLEQSLQTEMENCDTMIQRFMNHASEIRGFMAAHGGDLAQLTNDVTWLQRKYEGVKTTLDEDIVTLAHLKDLVKSDADIAKMAFAGADQLKLPAHYHQTWLTRGGTGSNAPNGNQDRNLEDVLTLFSNEADRLKELHQFQVQKIKEMEQHMPGVEHGLYERVRALRDQTQVPAFNMVLDLLETIKMMGDKIYEAAGGIVDVREKLTQLQRQYPTK
ncbi:Nucleoporin NUP49 [Colletotrichum aenigma]|uniref:Nucleoporin NUP49 n=1 Tax=Colletotrichum aenigma TaxID=1215731 RepID=UPI0018722667|nr:Nucleoporin NUP49 [Colletotrichum aenigma]KAF5524467.1 Nucleoporin NUP49 [Colletotrichum aenigma]